MVRQVLTAMRQQHNSPKNTTGYCSRPGILIATWSPFSSPRGALQVDGKIAAVQIQLGRGHGGAHVAVSGQVRRSTSLRDAKAFTSTVAEIPDGWCCSRIFFIAGTPLPRAENVDALGSKKAGLP